MKQIPIEYYERSAELLRYEPETGRLIRRVTTSHNAQAGDEAGTEQGSGYRHVSITVEGKNKFLYTHRIIWFMHHGELPDFLDHINGKRSHNRIENLRCATGLQNRQNTRSRKDSSSKYLGVSWFQERKKWVAQIKINGKPTYLGIFIDEVEAAKAYDSAAREHFGEFANPNFK